MSNFFSLAAFKILSLALAAVAQWIEAVSQSVANSISVRAHAWVAGQASSTGRTRATAH